jgi:hypothetical protein
VDNAGLTALGYLSYAQYRCTIIVQFDYVALLDAPRLSVARMYSGYPVAVTILLDTMARDILQPGSMGIIMGMERIPGMGRQ